MILIIIFIALLFTLDFVAMRWGFESRDGLDSLHSGKPGEIAWESVANKSI
jgi:hypothetical protein